jgi:Protein of unknown function (DUF1207)
LKQLMNTPTRRTLRVLATACLAIAGRAAAAPPTDATPAAWQPYREGAVELSLPESVGLQPTQVEKPDTAPAVSQAQWAAGETVVCPQPMCATPGCPTPCYMSPGYASPGDVSVYLDPSAGPPTDPAYWEWRVLPSGVIWQSYMAGVHEPRISGVAFADDQGTGLLDVTLGGRASLLRYGTDGPGRPQGLELQIEGAGLPRLNLDENWDLAAADFRFGMPLVYGRDLWQTKFSYYHLSSHMGDEFAIRNDALDDRINFSRDCLALGLSYFPLPACRLYTEAAWAFHSDVAEQWEFQFGADLAQPGPTGVYGTPFLAINGHIREELDYGGNVVLQAGWLWRGNSTSTLRLGFHYFNGKSNQFEFFDHFEEQIGGGVWYDF